MKNRLSLFLLIVVAAMAGCLSELMPVEMPLSLQVPAGSPLITPGKSNIEGVYSVVSGAETFGDTLVVHWSNDELCFYSGTQVIFCESAGARIGDSAIFSGYYRFVRSERMGNVSMTILPAEGGSSLRNNTPCNQVIIRGSYDDHGTTRDLLLKFGRPIAPRTDSFYIIGNCAGGRNSERLGRSENSMEMAKFCNVLGCTGIEIDLHVTKDGEVILMHDDSYSPRTVMSTYVLGDVSGFTLSQVRHNARLIHGEELPELNEFLKFVVDSTDLQMVWLDPKVSTGVEKMIQAEITAERLAKDAWSTGKRKDTLAMFLGLPSVEIMNAYRAAPSTGKAKVLCELAPEYVRTFPKETTIWGPRWTNGTQAATVNQLRSEGYRVWPWTIDSPDFMTQFLRECRFDGILSNYPSMLTGQYYQFGIRK